MSAAESHILPVYSPPEQIFVRGEGSWIWDDKGDKYLDCIAGIAVNAFGHGHPYLLEKLQQQAARLWHCSNQFVTPQLEEFSQRLVDATFADSIFFCSSGTEAVEAGIKFMRRYHYETGAPYRHRIITFEGGFHGRTFMGMSMTGKVAPLGVSASAPRRNRSRRECPGDVAKPAAR